MRQTVSSPVAPFVDQPCYYFLPRAVSPAMITETPIVATKSRSMERKSSIPLLCPMNFRFQNAVLMAAILQRKNRFVCVMMFSVDSSGVPRAVPGLPKYTPT